ncbi:DUF4199 domain-containing protein [Chitinophaga sp. Cy-1792]|uniref:DUF4199 domain-containing protein n=1 Tax=Chitinophaga sp. Cy-1792 TaxID=2608339 RepID=UPI00141F2FFC|nr:DUF4199 domain-containing protein [Chitinophaga sp. Cy-1792]
MATYKIEGKWAVIFFAMYLAWITLEKTLGFHSTRIAYQPVVSVMVLIPSFLLYRSAIIDKRKKYFHDSISFKQAFKSGMILTFFVILLSPLSQMIAMNLLSPDFFTNMRNFAINTQGMSELEANTRLNIRAYIIASIFGGLITGLIFSLLIAAFVRTKKST